VCRSSEQWGQIQRIRKNRSAVPSIQNDPTNNQQTSQLAAAVRSHVDNGIKRVAKNIIAAHGCDGNVEIIYGYPVTTNDNKFAEFTLDLAREVAGPKSVVRLPNPVMGAENFSSVFNELPGAMAFLADTPHDKNVATPYCHTELTWV
jgi:metal-dependent amidase/aminoacylase/carboxypeptidase family protein